MKYPLRVVERPGHRDRFQVADANKMIVCIVVDQEWGRDFAEFIVRAANRWYRWRKFFRKKTRDDWLWERNTPMEKWDEMWRKPFDWSGYDRSP